jgi:uncharacterized protein (DUF1501 family)
MLSHDLLVRMSPDGVLSRRAFLRTTAAAGAGGALAWADAVRAAGPELRKRRLACILLFMQGGPSQFETFDPKPGREAGGPTKAIRTAVPGIEIAEHWPLLARQMKEVALLRSLTGREGNHIRAQYLLHTGYAPAGSVKYPNFGSTVAKEVGDAASDLPNFVCVGGTTATGAGFLGMQYAPFMVGNPDQMPMNTRLPAGVDATALRRRLRLMGQLEKDFADSGAEALVADQRALNEAAAKLALSPRLQAFDLSKEREAVRDRYGRSVFGQSCLLARRLVETGVTFVEVVSSNWDTHRDNFNGRKKLAAAVDPAFAALLADLKDRRLLERTLVVCMGEFGRTPRINPATGRDHYPRAFSVALAGAGVKGGQVIGATDRDGTEVKNRPVTVPDLFCTLCQELGINPRRSTRANDRPIRIVEGGAPVKEVFA